MNTNKKEEYSSSNDVNGKGYYAHKKKGNTNIISMCLSSISLAISILVVVFLCCSKTSIFNLGDTEISILSILVTILIGWQIWTIIDIDKRIDKKVQDELDKTKQKMEQYINCKINEKTDSLSKQMNNLNIMSLLQQVSFADSNNDLVLALLYFIVTIHFSELNDIDNFIRDVKSRYKNAKQDKQEKKINKSLVNTAFNAINLIITKVSEEDRKFLVELQSYIVNLPTRDSQ